eukprot:659968-Amphidinium_carterae.13
MWTSDKEGVAKRVFVERVRASTGPDSGNLPKPKSAPMLYGGGESSTGERQPATERSRSARTEVEETFDDGVDYGTDEVEQGFIQDEEECREPEDLRSRDMTREIRRKVDLEKIRARFRGKTAKAKRAPEPPWFERIRRWQTICATGITSTHMSSKRKWNKMVDGLMDAGYGGVEMPMDYYINAKDIKS